MMIDYLKLEEPREWKLVLKKMEYISINITHY